MEARQFKTFNPDSFIVDIENTPFHRETTLTEPNEMWGVFKFLFLEVTNKHAPIQHRKVRSKCSPWIDSELMRKMRHRDYLKAIAVKTNTELDWLNYRNARKKN